MGLGGSEVKSTKTRESKRGTGAGDVQGTTAAQYALFLSDSGKAGQKAKPDIFPTIKWISVADSTRQPGDLEDRAAKYLRKENWLLINADFRLFTDMVKRWTAQLGGSAAVTPTVNEVVREWFEQSLVEVVLSANSLRGSQHWPDAQIEELLSEEGLTAAVLPRYHIDYSIKRSLGSKLGALKAKTT
jgi:hypothetical protein